MRIAILSTPFIRVPPTGYGGTELFCYELATGLHDRGHDVTLFTTGDSEVPCRKRSLYRKPQWPINAADEINHMAWAYGEIARHPEAFEVVHSNSVLGLPISRFVGLPIVHTLHHRREEEFSRIYVIHPEVHYVAISQRQLELEEPLPRASVIHHGVSPSRYPPSSTDEGYLLHLGRFAQEKGTHLAIDIARLAGLPLKLAGRTHPGDEAYFEEHVAPRLGPGVEQVGEADHARKVALLRGARALLCPLQWEEPFGLVAIEAMLCGTPVLGFARGAFPEIVDEAVTGWLAADGDVHTLAMHARALERFDRLACARRASDRFSCACMAERYESVYERVAGGEHRERAA